MKKIITVSIFALLILTAAGCGKEEAAQPTVSDTPATTITSETPTEPTTTAPAGDVAGFIGTCFVGFNNSCQDYENSKNYEASVLESECLALGAANASWSTTACPAEYVSGCKSQTTGLNGGTVDVTIWYKAGDTFLENVKAGCKGQWIDR